MDHSSSPAPDSTAKSGDGTTARTWVSLALTGAKVHICNADSNPSAASACINEAVKAGAAAIVTDAMDDSFASSAYAAAISAKIPVVATDNDDPHGFPKSPDVTTVDTGVPLDARLAADWIIAKSGGKADVLFAAARGSGSSRRPTCPPAPAPRPPTPPGPGTRTGSSRSCTRSCGACKNR